MTSADTKYFDPTIRQTLQELSIPEALTAYDARRNELILSECVSTLRRCATLLEQGKDFTNESFTGATSYSDTVTLILTPNLVKYGITLTAEDFLDYNPYVPDNSDPLDPIFKGYSCK